MQNTSNCNETKKYLMRNGVIYSLEDICPCCGNYVAEGEACRCFSQLNNKYVTKDNETDK